MSTLFVTATGTEIGKTLVTAALCHQLRAAGQPVRVLKPVLSGYDPATLADSDPGVLLASLGEAATEEAVASIAPWRFAAPLSPDMAAAREGRRLDLAEILAYCRAAAGDPLLIEGIGGAMVPISERHTVLDWIAELGAPALVVTGSYLGTISHTLTTLAAIRGRGVPIAGLVISESAESPVALTETAETINRHAGPLPTVLVPRLPTGPAPWREAPPLARALGLLDACGDRQRTRFLPTRQETPVSKGITT